MGEQLHHHRIKPFPINDIEFPLFRGRFTAWLGIQAVHCGGCGLSVGHLRHIASGGGVWREQDTQRVGPVHGRTLGPEQKHRPLRRIEPHVRRAVEQRR